MSVKVKPWLCPPGPRDSERTLSSGNIESVVPAILPHFLVKMWPLTEQENHLDIKRHEIELKNNNRHHLRTAVPPHFLLLSSKVTS